MKSIIAILLIGVCLAKPLISKDFINQLKKTATWEVTEYEENVFKGIDDYDLADESKTTMDTEFLPSITPMSSLPSSINWASKGASCAHEPRNMGDCAGASFAFAVAGMVSDRCCLKDKDHGWLSTMEIVSCSEENYGCAGGWPMWATQYVASKGLVDEACYPYNGKNEDCPDKCKTSADWKASHVCKCSNPVTLRSVADLKTALTTGPAVVTFEAYDDLYAYKSGIYCHVAGRFRRLISVRVVGYSDETTAHIIAAMPFGTEFGEKGFMNMCITCCGMFGKYEKGNVACSF
ncbi:MAG: C1 family peptidase [Acidobacteriaceae bacterium]|nr:C1 family peptidase [Acidobacteriaceae bacterium]